MRDVDPVIVILRAVDTELVSVHNRLTFLLRIVRGVHDEVRPL